MITVRPRQLPHSRAPGPALTLLQGRAAGGAEVAGKFDFAQGVTPTSFGAHSHVVGSATEVNGAGSCLGPGQDGDHDTMGTPRT